MLRKNIKRMPGERGQLILQTNHNYFIRTAIATVADLVLASVILVVLVAIITGIGTAELENAKTASDISTVSSTMAFFYFVVGLCYTVYAILKIRAVSKLYRQSIKIENEILGEDAKPIAMADPEVKKPEKAAEPDDSDEDL